MPTHWKRPWCWERLRARGEGDNKKTRWLDGITDLRDMSLSKPWETVKDREAWRATVHAIAKSQTWLELEQQEAGWKLIETWIQEGSAEHQYLKTVNTTPLTTSTAECKHSHIHIVTFTWSESFLQAKVGATDKLLTSAAALTGRGFSGWGGQGWSLVLLVLRFPNTFSFQVPLTFSQGPAPQPPLLEDVSNSPFPPLKHIYPMAIVPSPLLMPHSPLSLATLDYAHWGPQLLPHTEKILKDVSAQRAVTLCPNAIPE